MHGKGAAVKNLPASAGDLRDMVRSLGQEDPLEKEMATHSVFLPGESHGQRSLAGYSLWGCKCQTQWSDKAHVHTGRNLKVLYTIQPSYFKVIVSNVKENISQ